MIVIGHLARADWAQFARAASGYCECHGYLKLLERWLKDLTDRGERRERAARVMELPAKRAPI
jgi:hypothetical protein